MLDLTAPISPNSHSNHDYYINRIYKKVEPVVYKCALTTFVGLGTFFLCEGIVRIPFLYNSTNYLPIHYSIIYIAEKLRVLHDGMEFVVLIGLQNNYTATLYGCIGGPILEELVNRLIFQELILNKGITFFASSLGISFDPNSVYAKVSRVALSSFVFAAQHRWAFNTSLTINPYRAATLIYLVVMGSILGATQEVTKNTAYPITIHVINNTLTYYLT